MSARVRWTLRWRLSVLWALQWGITGAILTYLPLYFKEKHLSDEFAQLMAVTAVGLWVAPFVVGQLCDRWMASEKYLAVSHFVGGVTLVAIPIATDMYNPHTGANFTVLLVLFGLYAVAYFPTIPLASSLTFRHLPDPDTQFSKVRIWGTVGWMLAGLSLSLWLGRNEAYDWLMTHFPSWQPTLRRINAALSWMAPPSSADCFRIAALLSFALSSFCIFLPHTPPVRTARGAIAPLQTFKMFKSRRFSLLIAVSFLLSIVVPLYTLEVPKLLEQMGYDTNWIPAVMTIGQISEFPALLLLPFCLKRFGLKTTFALGMGAWLVRYLLFTFNQPAWPILLGIAFHGVCHVFLIIVIQLYVDSVCRSDLRASAQNLFAFITMGIGMPLGFYLGGKLAQWCRDAQTGRINYDIFFSVPAAVILVLLLIYWRWFQVETPERPVANEPSKESLSQPVRG